MVITSTSISTSTTNKLQKLRRMILLFIKAPEK